MVDEHLVARVSARIRNWSSTVPLESAPNQQHHNNICYKISLGWNGFHCDMAQTGTR